MKKALFPVLALVLAIGLAIPMAIPFASLVYANSATLVAGNDVIDRVRPGDSWTNFYLVDTTNPFNADGQATEWEIWVGKLVPVQLFIYRNTSSVWSVVETSSVETPTTFGAHTFTLTTPIQVQAGDFVGLYYPGPGGGAVEYDMWGTNIYYNTTSGPVLFTRQNPTGPTAFEYSSDRTYSVRVTGDMCVDIDIKPGSYPNSINLGSNGVVPVAILGSPDFDAATVDPFSVALSGASVRLKGKSGNAGSLEDVNEDGILDLVVQVCTNELLLVEGSSEAVLTATLNGGGTIYGVDTVNIAKGP